MCGGERTHMVYFFTTGLRAETVVAFSRKQTHGDVRPDAYGMGENNRPALLAKEECGTEKGIGQKARLPPDVALSRPRAMRIGTLGRSRHRSPILWC